MNALGTNLTKTVNNAAKAANTALTTNVAKAMNAVVPVSASAPMNTSLLRLGNGINQLNNQVQAGFNQFGNSLKNTVANTAKAFNVPAVTNAVSNVAQNMNKGVNTLLNNAGLNTNTNLGAAAANSTAGGVPTWAWFAGAFLVLIGIFVGLFFYFSEEIKTGYNHLFNSIRGALGLDQEPVPQPPASEPTTEPPSVIQETEAQKREAENILEKVLPLGRSPEVFNVSKNDFTYYDAEPLCKALGAELATYEQVKDAYEKGADWCNYGWTKGQVAVYPTQKATWEDLQKGPDDERGACGRPGLNGGYFDNPEMRFGVNCYGPKPSQSAHDEAELMKEGRIPRTVDSLKIDQKVRQFEAQADELGILPFNKGKWATA